MRRRREKKSGVIVGCTMCTYSARVPTHIIYLFTHELEDRRGEYRIARYYHGRSVYIDVLLCPENPRRFRPRGRITRHGNRIRVIYAASAHTDDTV